MVAQDQFFESNGVRIHYRDVGAGEPVVLIHALGNSLESAWIATGVISALARDHRVIAFDSRGHGKSGKPSDPAAYGLEMPRDVVRLLDHLRVRRAHVVGYSQGAAIAGKLLTISPERVITALFVGAPARVNRGDADQKFAAAQVTQFNEDPPFRSQILRGVQHGQPTPSEGCDSRAVADIARWQRRHGFGVSHSWHGASTCRIGVGNPVSAESNPLHHRDCVSGPSGDDGFARLVPRARLATVEGAAHAGPRGVLNREEFIRTTKEFLASRLLATCSNSADWIP